MTHLTGDARKRQAPKPAPSSSLTEQEREALCICAESTLVENHRALIDHCDAHLEAVAQMKAKWLREQREQIALAVGRLTVSEAARTSAYPIDAALIEAIRIVREWGAR